MKKRLLLLPLFAGMVLSGCDFSLESLKFWEKKTEVVDEGGDNKPSGTTTVDVTGVSISASSASLKVGETKQLTATVSPSDATNKSVTWSTSASSIASVSSSGLVTAQSAGTATITATSVADSSKKATCTVTVSESGGGGGGEEEKTFADAVSEVNAIYVSHGVTATISLPEPAGFIYDEVQDNVDYSGYAAIWCLSSETESSYFDKLVANGYTRDSEDGVDFASKGDFDVVLAIDEGYFGIAVYYMGDEGGEGGGDTEASYTLVTSNSALENGDVVVIKTEDGLGVTGYNNNKDATASSNESSWVRFVVGSASSSGWTLYDSGAGKYIAKPTSNVFKYDSTGGTCSVDSEGHLVCNGRYLCFNSTNGEFYRFYTSIGSYTPFFVYAVSGGSSGGGGGSGGGGSGGGGGESSGTSTTAVDPLSTAKEIASIIWSTSNPTLDEDYYYDSEDDYYYLGLTLDGTEEKLEYAVEYVVGLIKSVVAIDGEIEPYTYGTSLSGYEAYLYNFDESVEVNVYSDMDDTHGLVVYIDVYEADA